MRATNSGVRRIRREFGTGIRHTRRSQSKGSKIYIRFRRASFEPEAVMSVAARGARQVGTRVARRPCGRQAPEYIIAVIFSAVPRAGLAARAFR